MNNLNCSDKEITIKGARYNFIPSISCIFMVIFANKFVFQDNLITDLSGYVFLLVWYSFAAWIFFTSLEEATKTLTLCSSGIHYRSFIAKISIPWNEVEDWGLSYCKTEKAPGEIYYFYFSKEKLDVLNPRKKKFKGKIARIQVHGEDYIATLNTIVPYCKQHISVEPFISQKINH